MAASSHAKRILIVLAHGRSNPSGTVRALIYRGHFKEAGYEATFVDHYTDLDKVMRGLNRVYPLFSERAIPWMAAKSDIVYLCKVTSLELITRIRHRVPAARLVLDFGDALWLQDKDSAERFAQVLRSVDAVTTDNELTAQYIRQFNPNCVVIPDCPQVEAFDRRRGTVAKAGDDRIVIGWVGSPSTTYNLYVVWEALERLFAAHPGLHLRLLGADPRVLPPFEKVRYSNVRQYDQARMIDEVLAMHIGLFPLQDTQASSVRGVLKATVYMSGEAVPVCSPIGQSAELIRDGINGMLARDTNEWVAKIERLIGDPDTRSRIARSALDTVRERFTIDRSFERLDRVLSAKQNLT